MLQLNFGDPRTRENRNNDEALQILSQIVAQRTIVRSGPLESRDCLPPRQDRYRESG